MRACGLGATGDFCQRVEEADIAGKCSLLCRHSGLRAAGESEDASLPMVGCSGLRGCGGTIWSEGLGMRASSLEKDPNRLEPEDEDADMTGLGESWARGVLTMRGSKASEGRGRGRRPGDS